MLRLMADVNGSEMSIFQERNALVYGYQARIQDFPKGGGGEDIHKHRSRSRTLCIGFQYRDKFKGGGGGDHPCSRPPPPGSATGYSSNTGTPNIDQYRLYYR